ncbi:MAG: KH domain-containing protein [Lentisphaerae bacterium]|jgi:predicted RNA-binding protein YlqC (UPF0109 family)|nr:KH domain-containing protein [Lentisphaerota bacterium]
MAFSFLKNLFAASDDTTSPANNKTATVSEASPAASSASTADVGELAPPVSLAGLESFVLYVVRSLVDEPDEVRTATVERDKMSVIQITCMKKDIGKIIGKSGKTIAAIRSLVSGAAGRIGLRVTVDVLD